MTSQSFRLDSLRPPLLSPAGRRVWSWRIRLLSSTIVALLTFELCGRIDVKITSASTADWHFEGTLHHAAKPDNVFGYALPKNATLTDKCYLGGKLGYQTRYSLDRDGLRITPPALDASNSILFFGDSCTFGVGVSDTEAFPNQVAALSGGRYRIYNFAIPGYGPHQMLAGLDRGVVRRIVQQPPILAVYGISGGALRRALGLTHGYFLHTPRCVRRTGDDVTCEGYFDDPQYSQWLLASKWLNYSEIYARVLGDRRSLTRGDFEMAGLMLTTSAERLRAMFPSCRFEVMIVSPDGPHRSEELGRVLRRKGITVHELTDPMPRWWQDIPGLFFPDGHLTPKANRLVADYIVKTILGSGRS